MGCLFVAFGAFFPRIAVILIWLARPGLFEAAISSTLVALAGIVLLPFTTLMYVLLWTPAGLSGFDFVWLLLAFLIDLGGLFGSGLASRPRGGAGGFYSGGSTS